MGDELTFAWVELEKIIDKGYAVAFRKTPDGRFHARAVRSEKVIEKEGPTLFDTVLLVHSKLSRKKRSVGTRGR